MNILIRKTSRFKPFHQRVGSKRGIAGAMVVLISINSLKMLRAN